MNAQEQYALEQHLDSAFNPQPPEGWPVAYNKALEVINTQRIKSDQQRELLTIIATEVETECTCDASRDKCLHCRITECLEGK